MFKINLHLPIQDENFKYKWNIERLLLFFIASFKKLMMHMCCMINAHVIVQEIFYKCLKNETLNFEGSNTLLPTHSQLLNAFLQSIVRWWVEYLKSTYNLFVIHKTMEILRVKFCNCSKQLCIFWYTTVLRLSIVLWDENK